MPQVYEFAHTVSFEETNLIGNVYFVNHLRWQGQCREAFLRQFVPSVLNDIVEGLSLATVRCSCDYFAELFAFDEVVVRMRLLALTQNKITLGFEYFRRNAGAEELVARGEQQIACMRRAAAGLVATSVPANLVGALRPFGS